MYYSYQKVLENEIFTIKTPSGIYQITMQYGKLSAIVKYLDGVYKE